MNSPFLLATLLALAAGPLLYTVARRQASLLSFLDGFVMVSIAGLVGLEVVPGTFTAGGGWSLAFLALGLFGPTLLERGFRAVEREAHIATLVLAIIGLVLHALADGTVLAPGTSEGLDDWALPLSVVLHSLPVGMAVWWLLAPGFGVWPPTLTLLAMGLGTVSGYYFGVSISDLLGTQAWAWFQSLVAGSILHVVFGRPHLHQHDEHEAADHSPSAPRYEGLGNVMALVALAVIATMHTTVPDQTGWFDRFLSLALESAPALLLAYLIGGFLYGELPEPVMRWLTARGRMGQALRGTMLGLPLPVCSCSVLPLYQSLVKRGAPVAAALAFLVAAPEIGLTALFVSLPLLGVEMTLIRVAGAAVLALLVGVAVGKMVTHSFSGKRSASPFSAEHCEDHDHDHTPPSAGLRWRVALRAGFVDLVDGTAPWIVLGIAIAAAAEPFLTQMLWTQWPDFVEVVLFALLGMPLYVCAAGITPLIAVLLAAGVSPGAALAFLLTGPATNIATFGMLRKLHGSALAWRFSVVAAGGAVAMGLAVNLLPAPSLPVLDHAAEESSWLQQISLVLLTLIYAGSLLRRGARASLAELLN